MANGTVEIEVGLDAEEAARDAEKAGKEAGGKYADGFDNGSSNGLKGAVSAFGKMAAAATLAGAAATVSIGKAALEAYANYEQLVGGVDTLFKENSAQLQAYANQAYMNAGMSANDYMETVTSFSAALIRSLDGDTAAAAEAANTAIQDMADNANKMGTSLDVVRETYSSLARGNYEMLDNLKLGYAGTKAGLEELLADAERFKAAQGEIVDYSVDSYADIVEALHVVQTEMGITGTTAEEAATTIQGSLNMANAAWQNWLVAVAQTDGDIVAATENLVESVATAASNIVPRIGEILATLGTFLLEQIPVMLDSLIATISAGGVEMASAGLDYFLNLVLAIVKATPQILQALLLLLASLVVAVVNKAVEMVSAGIELIKGVAQGIADGFWYVWDEITRGLDEALQKVKNKVSSFFSAGSSIVTGLADGLRSAVYKIADAGNYVMSILNDYVPHSPAKKGPFSGRGWTLYSGQAIVTDLAKGMRIASADALSQVDGIMGDFSAAVAPRFAVAGATTSSATYTFGDVHLNASDAYGITAIEQLVQLIETA